MIRNFERMRHEFFARAIGKSVMREPRWHARINDAFVAWATSVPPPQSDVIENQRKFERASENPLTQNYFESTVGLVNHPGGVDPWLVELARVSVPASRVAVVKSFEQVLIHDDLQGDTVFSLSSNWGNPFVAASTTEIDRLRWLWRVEKTTGAVAPFLSVQNPVVFPGIPHPEIAEMNDLWFPAGAATSQNIHITVGGGYTLRVFALIELTAAYSLRVAAKIRGFDISEFDPMTWLAIRSIW